MSFRNFIKKDLSKLGKYDQNLLKPQSNVIHELLIQDYKILINDLSYFKFFKTKSTLFTCFFLNHRLELYQPDLSLQIAIFLNLE